MSEDNSSTEIDYETLKKFKDWVLYLKEIKKIMPNFKDILVAITKAKTNHQHFCNDIYSKIFNSNTINPFIGNCIQSVDNYSYNTFICKKNMMFIFKMLLFEIENNRVSQPETLEQKSKDYKIHNNKSSVLETTRPKQSRDCNESLCTEIENNVKQNVYIEKRQQKRKHIEISNSSQAKQDSIKKSSNKRSRKNKWTDDACVNQTQCSVDKYEKKLFEQAENQHSKYTETTPPFDFKNDKSSNEDKFSATSSESSLDLRSLNYQDIMSNFVFSKFCCHGKHTKRCLQNMINLKKKELFSTEEDSLKYTVILKDFYYFLKNFNLFEKNIDNLASEFINKNIKNIDEYKNFHYCLKTFVKQRYNSLAGNYDRSFSSLESNEEDQHNVSQYEEEEEPYFIEKNSKLEQATPLSPTFDEKYSGLRSQIQSKTLDLDKTQSAQLKDQAGVKFYSPESSPFSSLDITSIRSKNSLTNQKFSTKNINDQEEDEDENDERCIFCLEKNPDRQIDNDECDCCVYGHFGCWLDYCFEKRKEENLEKFPCPQCKSEFNEINIKKI